MKYCLYILIVMLLVTQALTHGSRGSSDDRNSVTSSSDKYSCSKNCAQNQDCIQKCETQDKIIGIVVCGGGTTLIILFLSCILCNSLKCCPCHEYQRLRRNYNKIDHDCMTTEEFICRRDHVIENFRRSDSNDNYYFWQKDRRYNTHITSVTILKQDKPLLTNIQIAGTDNFGDWSALGYILPKNNQIYLWFYKEYKDKKKAGQIGKWQHLIHQTTQFHQNQFIAGKWYYKGYEQSEEFSGTWKCAW